MYEEWESHVDYQSKHRRLKRRPSIWSDKRRIYSAFDQFFHRFRDSIVVVSYRSDGIPSEQDLVALLRKYKSYVQVEHYGQYKYVLSKNTDSRELLLVGK